MKSLSGDMGILVQNILKGYEIRAEAVGDLRTNVRLQLNNYRTVQMLISAEQKKALDKYRTVQMAISAEQKKALDKYMEVLRREVAETSLATRKFLKEVAAHQQQSLIKGRKQLMDEVTATRSAVRTDQAEVATIWANISQLKQENRIKKGSATSSQVVAESPLIIPG